MKNYLHPHYADVACKRIATAIWDIVNKVSARIWRVKLGRECEFRGKAIFRTLPDTQIVIGERCRFNSSHRSNLIGVYSPCMVSTLSSGAKVIIGNGCGFSGTVIAASVEVELGDNVRCGANTLITDTDWHHGDARVGKDAPVKIGDNVWLGYGVKVLKGVTIGENSLIGAGSIVTKDIPANVIAVGNPCKEIKRL